MTGVSSAPYTVQQQCGVANLPAFRDRRNDEEFLGRPPPADRLQAIVPAYTFNCTGRVTEWRACVEPGGRGERYYIQFQVWRATGVPGCYTRVEYNAPPLPNFVSGDRVDNAGELLRPTAHCVHLPVSESEQIQFQPGDVIGYYADRFRGSGNDEGDGGVQLVRDQNVVVYNRIDVPLDDLKTQYAIPDLGPDPSSCGFELEGSDSSLFQMTSFTSGAPIISLSLTVTTQILSFSSLTSTFSVSGRSADFSPSPSPSVSGISADFSPSPSPSVSGRSGSFSPSPSRTVSVEDGGSGPNLLLVVAILLVILIITIGM